MSGISIKLTISLNFGFVFFDLLIDHLSKWIFCISELEVLKCNENWYLTSKTLLKYWHIWQRCLPSHRFTLQPNQNHAHSSPKRELLLFHFPLHSYSPVTFHRTILHHYYCIKYSKLWRMVSLNFSFMFHAPFISDNIITETCSIFHLQASANKYLWITSVHVRISLCVHQYIWCAGKCFECEKVNIKNYWKIKKMF